MCIRDRREASQRYAQAASIVLDTDVVKVAATAAGVTVAAVQEQFENLIDAALWQAVTYALDAGDAALAVEHLTQIVSRNRSPASKADAQQQIQQLQGEQ